MFLLPDFFYYLLPECLLSIFVQGQSPLQAVKNQSFVRWFCQRVGLLLFATHRRYGISKYYMFGKIAIRRYPHSCCRSYLRMSFLQTFCFQSSFQRCVFLWTAYILTRIKIKVKQPTSVQFGRLHKNCCFWLLLHFLGFSLTLFFLHTVFIFEITTIFYR